ncbi:MAG: carboxylating nicotinate-nucleotide diphosphorylase [Chloroflexi bacterium]|nr:carboxylating nicotinate-nucleotide diphosphorylase [Chloroflexota bacterium]
MRPLTLEIARIIDRAIDEDLAWGDLTTQSLIPPNARAKASAVGRQAGVIAGVEIATDVFQRLDPTLIVDILATDGAAIQRDAPILRVDGRAHGILAGERVALNFLQRMSGISTLTARFVEAVSGTQAKIIDTRKTTPGLRVLEKYAVRVGGGFNHRFNLSDGILIKDNHIATLESLGGGLRQAIAAAKTNAPHGARVQVEVTTFDQAMEALDAGADALLLDNMAVAEMARVVLASGKIGLIEASGGITLERAKAVAETGVHLISVGALTHSAPALDISLDFQTQ